MLLDSRLTSLSVEYGIIIHTSVQATSNGDFIYNNKNKYMCVDTGFI